MLKIFGYLLVPEKKYDYLVELNDALLERHKTAQLLIDNQDRLISQQENYIKFLQSANQQFIDMLKEKETN